MTKTYYIDNNDNIDNNINDINDPYEYVAPDNSTNIEVDDDFYFYNFFTPFTLFTTHRIR